MTSVIEKRLSVHRQLESQLQENSALKSQVSRLQALANLGTTTAMIAHEINNLLTPLASYADLALDNPDDAGLARKALEKASRNCRRAGTVMESMLALASGETQHKTNVPLRRLVDEVFDGFCRDFAKDSITVSIRIGDQLKIWAVPVQIQQVLMNLILNARAAMLGTGGQLTIKAEEAPNAVEIEVADTGCGIEPSDLENIFQPFFSTRTGQDSTSEDQAAGLGLAFCKQIMEAHKGSICVESEPGRGTTFKIKLPKPQQGSQ